MNFRYEEVLSWIMPGFYLIFCIAFLYAYINIVPENDIEFWKNIAGIVNDFSAAVIFAIPLFSFVSGWILNAAGGFLFKSKYMRWPSARSYDLIYPQESSSCSDSGSAWCDKVKKYSALKKAITPEKVDRFYYRYVFSRNMVCAQLIIVILIMTAPLYSFFEFSRPWTIISFVVLVIYLAISWRDLHTHAIYVIKEAKAPQRSQ